MTESGGTDLQDSYKKFLAEQLAKADSFVLSHIAPTGNWQGTVWPSSPDAIRNPQTGFEASSLKSIGKASVTYPADFVCCQTSLDDSIS